MRVGLVAMPWRRLQVPSYALATLLPFLRQAGYACEAHYLALDVAAKLGFETYEAWLEPLLHGQLLQEACYAGLLFPDRRDACTVLLSQSEIPLESDFWPRWEQANTQALEAVDWSEYDVIVLVGDGVVSAPMTQFLASLYGARHMRQVAPAATILLAGPDFAGSIGQTVVQTVPWVDGAINGEIEGPLLAWLNQHAHGAAAPVPGVLLRDGDGHVALTRGPQLADIDALPTPDYDAFFAHPLVADMEKTVVIVEAARGCWWDRSATDPKLSCQFCNINVGWQGYRRRSLDRVVAMLRELTGRYPTRHVAFADTITWPAQAADLFAAIADADLNLCIETLEAHVSLPWEALYQMKRAGVRSVQLGVEALSPALLNRMNKGITFNRTVETLRTCAELGIGVAGNLIMNYPGSTDEDVWESLRRIRLISWLPPLSRSELAMGHDSPLHRRAATVGIPQVQNAVAYQEMLPAAWVDQLDLMHKSFACPEGTADWSKIDEILTFWRQSWKQSPPVQRRYYVDQPAGHEGKLVLIAIDGHGQTSVVVVTGRERRMFLYCRQSRRLEAIREVFDPTGDGVWIEPALNRWVDLGFMLHEEDHYLSAGIAGTEDMALKVLTGRLAGPLPVAPALGRAPRLTLRPNIQRPNP